MTDETLIILEELESEILECDQKAKEAFKRSKYAIAEYWLCIVFKFQSLHRRITKRLKIDRKTPVPPFTEQVAVWRRSLV